MQAEVKPSPVICSMIAARDNDPLISLQNAAASPLHCRFSLDALSQRARLAMHFSW